MAKEDMKVPMLSLDATLDDIEALPAFVTLPTGAYKIVLPEGIQEKTINDGHYFDIQMKLLQTPGPGEVDTSSFEFGESAPKEGDITNFLFDRQHKAGQARFSDFCAPIASKFNTKSIRELMEKSKGLEMLIIVKREKNKESGKLYANIKHCGVL